MLLLLFDISIGETAALMGEKSRKIQDQRRPLFYLEFPGALFPLAYWQPLSSLYRKHYGPFFLMLPLNQLWATWKMPNQVECVVYAINKKSRTSSLIYLGNGRCIRVYNKQGKMWEDQWTIHATNSIEIGVAFMPNSLERVLFPNT